MTLKRRKMSNCFMLEKLLDYLSIYLSKTNYCPISMKTGKIIQVEVNFRHDLIVVKGSPFTYNYFSNLTLAFESVKETLLINGWDLDGFNYTAIYRSIKDRGSYVKAFKSKGAAFFKITICYKEINPKFSSLEITKNPY